jgi:hypothetical protein
MSGLDDILREQEDGEGESTPETTETKVEEKGTEESGNVEEVKGKEEEVEGTTPTPPEAPAIPPENNELNELRQFIREQRKEIAAMKAKLGRVKDTGEVDDEGNTKIEYTNLEKLQMELHNVAVAKTPVLEVLVEAMEANPKYEDIRSVCTKAHFDDIFEMAAATISRNEGRDFNEVLVQLELEVWNKANPYKYMYTIIKENHPQYKGKEEKKKEVVEEKAAPVAASAKKVLEAKAAPGSIAAAGGGGDTKGSNTWTSERIDSMDESELHEVPKDIYDKYMMGKLR